MKPMKKLYAIVNSKGIQEDVCLAKPDAVEAVKAWDKAGEYGPHAIAVYELRDTEASHKEAQSRAFTVRQATFSEVLNKLNEWKSASEDVVYNDVINSIMTKLSQARDDK